MSSITETSPRKERKPRRPTTNIRLYGYQAEAISACLDHFAQGKNRIAVSSPTGSGKTTMMLSVIERLWRTAVPDRRQVLILVPSIQIAGQIKDAAKQYLKGQHKIHCTIEVEQGENKTDGDADVTIATWRGLDRSAERIIKFDPEKFILIIVDEAHHGASPHFTRVLHYFNSDVPLHGPVQPIEDWLHDYKVPLLGFSATLSRHNDQYDTKDVFPICVKECDILELTKRGRLSRIKYTKVDVNLDIKGLTDVKEDDAEDVEPVRVEEEGVTPCDRDVVAEIKEHALDAGRRHILVFGARISHVRRLEAAFTEARLKSHHVTSKTPLDERVRLLKRFAEGEYPILINCGVFAEGTDIPSIDCVALVRPTKSPNLVTQMVGRGMRTSPATGKKNCLVLDFTVSASTGMHISPSLKQFVQ